MPGTHWDTRAARTVAAADADATRAAAQAAAQVALADAEAVRAATALHTEREQREMAANDTAAAYRHKMQQKADKAALKVQRRQQADKDRTESRRRWRSRRGMLAGAVRARVPMLVGAVAMGSPMLIAWSGQYGFGAEVMELGAWAITLPIATEGAVVYNAYLTHQAIELELPIGRYRFATWVTAGIAAAMNLWHWIAQKATADDPLAGLQIGAMYALASLMTIALWELTASLRQHRVSGLSGAQIRQAAWRRLRYPRLSWAAASIRAARGCSVEAAWHLAWTDRFGVGPQTSLRERRLAKEILSTQHKTDRKAARAGRLTLLNGVVLGHNPGGLRVINWAPPVGQQTEFTAEQIRVGAAASLSVSGDPTLIPADPTLSLAPSPTHPTLKGESRPTKGRTQSDGGSDSRTRRSGESRSRSGPESVYVNGRGRRKSAAPVLAESGTARPTVTARATSGLAPRRSVDEHRNALHEHIRAGQLTESASAEEIRNALGCGQKVALTLNRELKGRD